MRPKTSKKLRSKAMAEDTMRPRQRSPAEWCSVICRWSARAIGDKTRRGLVAHLVSEDRWSSTEILLLATGESFYSEINLKNMKFLNESNKLALNSNFSLWRFVPHYFTVSTYLLLHENKVGFYPCSLYTHAMFPDQSTSNTNFRVIIHLP